MGNSPSSSQAGNSAGSETSPDYKKRGGKKSKTTGPPSTIATKDKVPSAKKALKTWIPPEGAGSPGEATRLANAWVNAKNNRDMKKLVELAHPDACYRLPSEDICIPMRDFLEAIFSLAEAFPDLEYEFQDAAEPKSGVAVLYDYYATGTHTGTEYSFHGKAAVPPTGVRVLDGPVVKTLTIKNGKIIDFLVYAPLGNTVGPLAFYRATRDKYRQKKPLSVAN